MGGKGDYWLKYHYGNIYAAADGHRWAFRRMGGISARVYRYSME
jgi:hypothetical protein